VRILPPSLRVTTHPFQRGDESRGGDFVMLNDFELFPSASGGLTLNVAGQARTANYAVTGTQSLAVAQETVGSADLQAFTIPSGTLLLDPQTGLEFTLIGPINFQPRTPATRAVGNVLFRATPQAADSAVPIPKGTRITDLAGQVYEVTANSEIPPPSQRLSQGTVSFFAVPGGPAVLTMIQRGTILQTPDGFQFQTNADVVLLPGQREAVGTVTALQPGVDAAADALQLQIPVPGIALATNRAPTVRVAQAEVAVQSIEFGAQTNQSGLRAVGILLDRLPGIEGVFNDQPISEGTDAATHGMDPNGGQQLLPMFAGPVASLAADHPLVLEDPSILPKGVSPQDVHITAIPIRGAPPYDPAVLKTLDVERNQAGVITSTRIDPLPTQFAFPQGDTVWFRDKGTTSALLKQSDADPSYDTRFPRPPNTPTLPYFNYYGSCHSGSALESCGASFLKLPSVLGNGPTHANSTATASLLADGGFIRIQFDLAQPAMLSTKTELLSDTETGKGIQGVVPPGPPNVIDNGDVVDLGLRTEQTSASEQTVISVPMGDASFGAGTQTLTDTHLKRAVQIPTDAGSGLEVSGPGSAELLVGVVPFAQADKDHDGLITLNEFGGSPAAFASLEQPDALGILHPELTAAEAPFIPTGSRGALTLTSSASTGFLLGLQTIGDLPTLPFPQGGASLTVVAAKDILLQDRGFIGTLQGGVLSVSSIGGQILGGFPSTLVGEKRGIVTLYSAPGTTQHPADANGGGAISVDSFGDFNIGGLALAALSGSSITIDSRAGSVNAGLGAPFSSATVGFSTNVGGITVEYAGSGVFAQGGEVILLAKKDVVIGAGITGAGITINAGGNVLTGSGALTSTAGISLNVGGTISGNIQAQGSINVGSGTLSSGANVGSTGGLVTGAGAAAVASNTGSGRVSAENSLASNTFDRSAFSGGIENTSANAASGKRVVLIDVSSQPCSPQDKDCSS